MRVRQSGFYPHLYPSSLLSLPFQQSVVSSDPRLTPSPVLWVASRTVPEIFLCCQLFLLSVISVLPLSLSLSTFKHNQVSYLLKSLFFDTAYLQPNFSKELCTTLSFFSQLSLYYSTHSTLASAPNILNRLRGLQNVLLY